MDAIERASELSKARTLELDAAFLEIVCQKFDTVEQLKAAVLEVASANRKLASEIRAEVDIDDFRRN